MANFNFIGEDTGPQYFPNYDLLLRNTSGKFFSFINNLALPFGKKSMKRYDKIDSMVLFEKVRQIFDLQTCREKKTTQKRSSSKTNWWSRTSLTQSIAAPSKRRTKSCCKIKNPTSSTSLCNCNPSYFYTSSCIFFKTYAAKRRRTPIFTNLTLILNSKSDIL